jgi:hypothetical protein
LKNEIIAMGTDAEDEIRQTRKFAHRRANAIDSLGRGEPWIDFENKSVDTNQFDPIEK